MVWLGTPVPAVFQTDRSLRHTQAPTTGSYPEPYQSNPYTVLLSAEVISNLTETKLNVTAYKQQKRRHHDATEAYLLPHQAHTNRAVLT